MMRFVTLLIFIIVGYYSLHYVMRMLRQMYQRSERGGYEHQDWEHANTEEEYRQILGVTDKDSPATIKEKYKDLLAKYHPDKVSHLGDDFRRTADEKFKSVNEAYERIKKERDIV